jgi:4,5-dihydroxyphthalate decarboxylase
MRKLTIALGEYPHVNALLRGEVALDGYGLEPLEVRPIIGAYRRMIRDLEFDICELAPVTYVMALEAGIPITAIPVFLNRRFHHGDIQCAPGSSIHVPSDLSGRRMGVRAYSVSTGVWARGMLAEEYGVDHGSITWVVDDDDHVEGHLPPNLERVSDGRSLGELLRGSEIDAALSGNAGTGRAGAPRAGWTAVAEPELGADGIAEAPYPLFPHADLIASDYYLRTGICPLHSLIVVKRSLVDADPELPTKLYDAFVQSKRRQLDADPGWTEMKPLHAQSRLVGGDPIPYGRDSNTPSLNALLRYSRDQGLLDGSVNGALFAEGEYADN